MDTQSTPRKKRRREFSQKTKVAASERADGRCKSCGIKIRPGNGPEYDHIIEDYYDGGNGVENCQVLCANCHGAKTSQRAPVIAKSRRLVKSRANAGKRNRNGFNGWRKFDGTIVWRS